MLLYTGTPSQKTESEQILMDWGHELQNVSRISNIETCSQIAINQHRYCFVGYPSVGFRPMDDYFNYILADSLWQAAKCPDAISLNSGRIS